MHLAGAPDGTYGVHLEPRGMWWCKGSLDEFEEDDDRVPYRLWNPRTPPVLLESEDVVEVQIQGCKVI